MPASPADSALGEARSNRPFLQISLSRRQKLVSLGFSIVTAGYAAFADAIACVYMVRPIRSEYQFEDQISEARWNIIAVSVAGTYGFYTFSCEGKSVYDTAAHYFLKRNGKAVRRAYLLTYGDFPELAPAEEKNVPTALAPSSCHQKLAHGTVHLFSRFVCLVGSLADSTETTMGLVKEHASLSKTIAVSSLSFLSSISFYGPLAVDAFEELFLGKKIVVTEDPQPSYLLAKVIGYPIAAFSAIQDTLECGAGLFDNFSVTDTSGQWALVGASSLAGISSLCLDGKKGVEVLDCFFAYLENHYAWLPDAFIRRRLPTLMQFCQLGTEGCTIGLAAYGASYIAFADRELTIALTREILKTLGVELPLVPEFLGWGMVLKDFIIQTNTLNKLEWLTIHLTQQAWTRLRPAGGEAEAIDMMALPEMEEAKADREAGVELAVQPVEERKGDDEEQDDEETALLTKKQQPKTAGDEKKSCWHRFFKKKPRHPKQEALEPRQGTSCTIL